MVEGDPLTFTLVLSHESSTAVEVRFATVGTASADEDYDSVASPSVTFEPGETLKTITIESKRDYDEDEPDETVIVKLQSALGARIVNSNKVGTIFNLPAPGEISVRRFYGDGASLRVDYTIAGDVFSPFKIAVGISFDGEGFSKEIAVGDGEMDRGHHTLLISPAFEDIQCDYRWMVFVDSEYSVTEVNEENNFVYSEGGAFIARDPISGKRILHVHGTDEDDFTSHYRSATVDEVHFRGHAGDDRFDLHSFLPGTVGWLFGAEGDDTLIASTANDIVFGGPGNDILRGGDGGDLLVGGNGPDKLYGEGGKDELFGGPDMDELVDPDEDSMFDGGPDRDLFNGNEQNPRIAPVYDTFRDHYRGVDEEHELRIDLVSRFRLLMESFPQHTWQVKSEGAAIARYSVKDDVLHIQFNANVPDDSLIDVHLTGGKSDDVDDRKQVRTEQSSFHVYSIAVTGYKLERKTGPGENDWTEEQGAIWSSDLLRWSPLYEPRAVPIQWDVLWVSKPWKDLDHPRIEWDVFSTGTRGQTPVANPPTGIRAITPQFIFKRG